MDTLLQFAVLGLGLGATYVAVASGLLLMYRATGIVNFAQSVMGAWGAYVFVGLRSDGTLVLPIGSVRITEGPTPLLPAVVIGLVYAMVLGVACYWLVFRPVRHAPELAHVVISVALMLTLAALATIRFGSAQLPVESVFGSDRTNLFGVDVSSRELWMAGSVVVIAVVMWAYLRFTRSGAATRASAENERAVVLMGFSPNLLATIALGFGTGVSALGIIFGGSLSGLSVENSLAWIVPATAVLLMARMRSVFVVLVAGLALGAFQSSIYLLTAKPWWPQWAQSGIEYVLFFAIVIAILLVLGRRLPSRGSIQTVKLPDVTIPRFRPVPAALLVAGALLVLVVTDGGDRFAFTMSLIFATLFLSFVIVVGYLGQVSLAQLAVAGTAAFTLSKLTMNTGLGFPLTVLLSATVATVLGVLVAIPAIRIRGSQLAIVTLAGALVLERFVFGNVALTPLQGNVVGAANVLGINLAVSEGRDVARLPFALMVLATLVLVVLLFIRIASGSTGRAFLAVRANERSAASSGVDVRSTKLIGFGLAAFVAGLAGTMIAMAQGQVSEASFSVQHGLTFLAIAYLGGISSPGGAIVAGFLAPAGFIYTLTQEWLSIGDYYALISGIALIITAIANPVGIAGTTGHQISWARQRLVGDRQDRSAPPPEDRGEPATPDAAKVLSEGVR